MTESPGAHRTPGRFADLVELTKPGITGMVMVTAALGLLLAGGAAAPVSLWVATLLGTGLVSAGASAGNHVLERQADARMRRTAQRPLPAGRIAVPVAAGFGLALAVAGLVLLALGVNLLTALLGLLAIVGYVAVYTPLKSRTSLSTLIGGVPGSIPALMGWAAMRNALELPAWVLFGILFFWQIPHFFAIAWLCREDYARGGFPMLSVIDPSGRRIGRQAVLYALPLLPVSLLFPALGLAGWIYLAGATILGLVFLGSCFDFAWQTTPESARRLLWVSLIYLPGLLAALLIDRFLL